MRNLSSRVSLYNSLLMESLHHTINLPGIAKLANTVQELSLAKDLESVMKIVRTTARKLTGADGATFVLRDNKMCYYADEDAISPLWKGSRFPMENCISGWVMNNKKSVIIPDIYKDERIPYDAYRPTFVKSLAMVPIRTLDPIGAIGNYWAQLHLPTPEELTLLQALADITAVSIENINVRNKLEERLKERELMLEQLENQKKQLEEFTQIVSHNLRAPLTNLLLLSDLVATNDNVDDKLRLLKKQNQIVSSLHSTFEELVVAAQVKSDFKIEKNYIDLKQGILNILELLQGDILRTNASVTFDFSLAKSVYYPQKYFHSILLNLLSNAIRYRSPGRPPEIRVKSWKENGWIYLEVEDNGLGIDLKQHGHNIFKLHKTFHGNPQAKGFGLFITKNQVEAMGGNIRLESTVDKGSKFVIQLAQEK